MDFIIKDIEGNEQGPVNQETLLKWVAEGRVKSDTPVRNSLLKAWKCAEEFSFLKPALDEQLKSMRGQGKSSKHPENSMDDIKTAFEYRHYPDPASAKLRIAAFIGDLVPLLLIGAIFFALGYGAFMKKSMKLPEETATDSVVAENIAAVDTESASPKDNPDAEVPPSPADNLSKGYKPGSKWTDSIANRKYSCFESDEKSAKWIENRTANEIFYFYLTFFFFFALLYYGITLGTFAQTFGMWFFGIFIARNDKDLSEVLHFRAFVFSVFMFVFGIFTPLLAVLPGRRTALHDILSGVRVYKIAGKPKD